MTDIVNRLRFDAVRCEIQFSKGVAGNISAGADEIQRLREALKFARQRIVYYGTISDRRHFDHDLAEVYPKIDAALNQQSSDR